MEKATITKTMETLADIAAASVLKNLVGKWAEETTTELRWALQIDKATLKKAAYIGERTQVLEKYGEQLAERIKEYAKEIQLLKKRIAAEESESKRLELEEKYSYACFCLQDCREEKKQNNIEIDMLYKALGESLGDGNDLKQVAFLAMWEHVETVEKYLAEHETEESNILTVVGNIVVDREYKTVRTAYRGISKEGNATTFYKAERDENGEVLKAWQDITLQYVGARAVNRYINQYRNKAALNTVHIITGYDSEGHELTIQNSKLETLGGVDSVEEKLDFETAWKKIESVLTSRQCEIIKLVLAGFSYSDIAGKLGVKENTVKTHVFQIREKAREVFPNWEK